MNSRTNRCSSCGTEVNAAFEHCPECDHRLRPRGAQVEKSAGVAAVLSLIVTGMGQIYLGRVGRGLGWLFVGFLLGILLASDPIVLLPLALAIQFAAATDAYHLTEKVNRA